MNSVAGSDSPLADRPSCCSSFAAALDSGHADCMRHWHGALAAMGEAFLTREGRAQLNDSARLPSAEVLMYMHDVLHTPWDVATCVVAAMADSVACLRYAHCSGCPWRAEVCSSAAAAGSMACLMYAHEHGCEWNSETCAAAARSGHLGCLVYAHKHGCP